MTDDDPPGGSAGDGTPDDGDSREAAPEDGSADDAGGGEAPPREASSAVDPTDDRFLGTGVVTGDPGVSEDTIVGGTRELGGGAVLTTGDTTVIARTVARISFPIILLTSLSLLFQGHNLPGGGFIGGVLTAIAFALLFIVYGLDFIREEVFDASLEDLPLVDGSSGGSLGGSGVYRWVFSVGLALAVASGLAPIVYDLPFLTQAVYLVEHVPLFGELELASALAFDLGVYFVVVGGLLTIVQEVGGE